MPFSAFSLSCPGYIFDGIGERGGCHLTATVGWTGYGVDHRETVIGSDSADVTAFYHEPFFPDPGEEPSIHLFLGASSVSVRDMAISVALYATGENSLYPEHVIEGSGTCSETFTVLGPTGHGTIGFAYERLVMGLGGSSQVDIRVNGSDLYEIVFGTPFEVEFNVSYSRTIGAGFFDNYEGHQIVILRSINVIGMDPDQYHIISANGILYPVPEPATLLLVVLGGGLLCVSRCRKR